MSLYMSETCTASHGKACTSSAVTLCTQPERCPSPMLSSLPPPEGERRERRHRPRFRADGTRRRTPGELAKRTPFARYWKDVQARQRRRTEEPASSSGRAPEPSWSWESWSRWDWQDDSWRGSRWQWSQASPDDDWEDRYYNDSDRQADDAADADIEVNWDVGSWPSRTGR